ncbi:unnamed protein product, partial [Schistosoma margrebowiei]
TCSRLPLTRIPLDCYLSPECEGHEEELNKNDFILPNTDVNHWDGPYFDWLSTVRPSASPYLPQTGDRVVYLYRGHQDYLSKAWECGNLPLMGNLDQQKTNSPSSLPWITWPDLPVSFMFVMTCDVNGYHVENSSITIPIIIFFCCAYYSIFSVAS